MVFICKFAIFFCFCFSFWVAMGELVCLIYTITYLSTSYVLEYIKNTVHWYFNNSISESIIATYAAETGIDHRCIDMDDTCRPVYVGLPNEVRHKWIGFAHEREEFRHYILMEFNMMYRLFCSLFHERNTYIDLWYWVES